MQILFRAISEPRNPGKKWQDLFHSYWPAYESWWQAKHTSDMPDLKTSEAALKYYMPEMWPTYVRLCRLVKADNTAARFLTGFQPPAYISGCSQAVTNEPVIQLVRNYDYHPDLLEGTLLLSAWNGKKVIANSDCLSGVLDGMNEDGLTVSLAFGGRKEVGKGFGIPFILRYVLEFCSTTEEAVAVLKRVPSHMSYNVTVLDRNGDFKTVQMAPDKETYVTHARYATNHQTTIDWPENALFNKTVERADFLDNQLQKIVSKPEALSDLFLQAPLYSRQFSHSNGTLYTAIYKPESGTMQMRWPNEIMTQRFDDFKEQEKLITYQTQSELVESTEPLISAKKRKSKNVAPITAQQVDLAEGKMTHEKLTSKERKSKKQPSTVSWEEISNYWINLGKSFWEKWQN